MTNYNTLSTSDLVDAFGRMKAKAADLDDELNAMRKVIVKRARDGVADGQLFHAVVCSMENKRLDLVRFKEEHPHHFALLQTYYELLPPKVQVRVYARKKEAA